MRRGARGLTFMLTVALTHFFPRTDAHAIFLILVILLAICASYGWSDE